MSDKKRSYLIVRKIVDDLNAEAQQHLDAYQGLASLCNSKSGPRGTLAIWGQGRNPIRDQPNDVVSLQQLPAAFVRHMVTALMEYHKAALQEADRKIAELAQELVSLHNQEGITSFKEDSADTSGERLDEKIRAFVGAEEEGNED